MSSLTYGIVKIESLGLVAPMVWVPIATGAMFLIGYGLWARGRPNAAIDMALFEDRTYAVVTLATFVFGIGLLLVGLSGAAVAGLPPSRFGVGGAVNNAVRQLGGVIGTAFAVVLIGQSDTPIAAFQKAFLWIAALSAATAGIAIGIPANRLPRPAGVLGIESGLVHEKSG